MEMIIMIQNQNNVSTLEQQIKNEFDNVVQLLNNRQVKQADSAFEKLDILLYELKRQNKTFVWQNWLNQINQSVQNLKSMKGIGDLQYIRFSTFIYNLQNFSKINEQDWNSRSMFYTKVADNGKFCPVQNGLENIGATCFMNATLQAMYNLSLFYDFIIRWKNDIDLGNVGMFNQQSFRNYQNGGAGEQCMWQLLMLFSALCNPVKNKYIKPTDFRNLLEVANPLFKKGQPGDSKDLIIYILEGLHKVITRPVSAFSNALPQLNQYDNENTLLHFLSDFQNETSSITDNFFSIKQTTNTCLYCKQVSKVKRQANPICYNYQKANLLIFPLEDMKNYKKNKENLKANENPVLSIKNCFEYNDKIDHFTGMNRNFCNICKQLYDSDYQDKIYSLPKTLILILNRGLGNQHNCTIDYPIYLDCSDTKVMNEDQRYEFKFLNSVIRHIGQSTKPGDKQNGYSAHFISINKSPKDGKWYCANDARVDMIGDGSDEAALTENKNQNWNIKRSVQNYNMYDTVPYIVSYTEMTAEKMLDYALSKVKDKTYREAMINKFYSLQYFTDRGDENRKRFAYLLMYAVAERRTAKVNDPKLTGLTEQEVSDLACATFEMLKHENNFLKPEKIKNVKSGIDGMDYYKSVIDCEAQAVENGRSFGKSWKTKDIINEINSLHGQGGRLSEHITINPNDFKYRSGYPLQQVSNQTQQNNFTQMNINNQGNNFNNQYNQNNLNNNINNQMNNFNNNFNNQTNNPNNNQNNNQNNQTNNIINPKGNNNIKDNININKNNNNIIKNNNNLTNQTNNINNNPQNDNVDIDQIVNNSESFAAFCSQLSQQNIALNQINFSKEPLGFWNCFKAFFLTLLDGVCVDCGFWNRMCLRVFFENARSKGTSYCFEATVSEGSNNQSLNLIEDQYKKNIKCLSELLKNAQKKANENQNVNENSKNLHQQIDK